MSDAISEIVQVTITANTAVPTQQGFNMPAIVGYHNHYADVQRTYTSTAGMVSDGFTIGEPLYLMAQAIFSQNPSPSAIVVGRLPAATARTSTLTVTDAVAGDVHNLTVTGKNGVAHAVTRVIPAASTTTLEAAALVTLINTALGSLATAANAGAVITITPAAVGETVFTSGISSSTMTYVDAGVDAGYPAALNNILAANPNWYGLAIEHTDAANIAAVAAWAEGQPVAFIAQTSDAAEILGAGPLGAALKAASYSRTGLLWSGASQNYAAAAWIGQMLTYKPGSATAMFKTLAGVPADNLTATHRSNLDAQNTNHYEPIAGLSMARYGKMASGQYLDQVIGTDWLASTMKTEVYALIKNLPKTPYTDVGIARVAGVMGTVLDQGVRSGFLEEGTTEVISQTVANASTADKGNRVLSNMQFNARMAGAIHKVIIQGSLSL